MHHHATVLPPLALLGVADIDVTRCKRRPNATPSVLSPADPLIMGKVDSEPLQRAVAVRGDMKASSDLLAKFGRL